ncbi:tyrosine-type recombinase/integrase [methanotrophic endosymbiont of Bathymodiolus puteoserpentis (Logatchev)]|jgi:integrase|uniref:tyrosine-type recombinase/integrase n=1 Tax=methanotrophic endosymbiont of Bathymodiolus puteoserpentis (Logatchev) TaxID=343235 RepID=UPI0013CD5EED|nr:site-specific integrase [methanotrophic endosymbiont of Bathymodiolus puteoserpentis (Logatchev)]SHE22072.1 Integrase [methanotrophic endosymbiont of Bathymodiolus puteoserpentis (Logatchev)]
MGKNVNKLSARKVASINKAGLYGDGMGLWLKVTKSGTKSWIFRYTQNKKTVDLGLGSIITVSLPEAREKALEYRQALQSGLNPKRIKQQAELKQKQENNGLISFEQCAHQYIAIHKDGWKNAKHAQQWTNTLKTYAFPIIGGLPVKDIDTALIMQVLSPIWTSKNETAGRIRGRIENILAWAAVHGYRSADNPAQWRGHLENLLAKPSKIKTVKHHTALPYSDMYEFIKALRAHHSTSAKALEFLILTATRTSEITGAQWEEIDLNQKVWTIPVERMKAGNEHRIPLSSRAVTIINEMVSIRQSDFVFAGGRIGKGLSNSAMDKLLQVTLGYDCTVHGFRSTFRDWSAECTNYPRDLCEMALAHTIKNKAEAAYRRGDMIEKRHKLAEDWLKFMEAPTPSGNVISIRKTVG